MMKDTVFAPHLIQLRTVLEVAGLIALALALRKVYVQRRMMQRLTQLEIDRGDKAARAARYD